MKPVWLLAFFVSTASHATEVAWIRAFADLRYKGQGIQCGSNPPGHTFFIATEIDKGGPSRIVISNHPKVEPYLAIYKSIELSPEEVGKTRYIKDKRGHYWLRTITLSSRALKWIIYYPSQLQSCKITSPLETIEPSSVTYDFETDDLDEGILISHSQGVKLTGTEITGNKYEAKLRLTQKEMWP